MRRTAVATLLLAAALALVVPSTAQAHWGDWHQSGCTDAGGGHRYDVWYLQHNEDSVDYWGGWGPVINVHDDYRSPNGWGIFDVYSKLNWECGPLGAPIGPEHDQWNCYDSYCGMHRVQEFEHGFEYYHLDGWLAFYTKVRA